MVLTLCGVLFSFAMYAQNETVNGELTVNGKTTISTNSDAIISLLNTDNSWQYIQYLQSGVRKAYIGLDASNNFVFGKENGGNFYMIGGNLGVGTSTADGVLHLKGNSTANDVLLKMELDGNRNWEFQQNGSGAGTGLKLKSTANKAFTLTSSDFFLFDPSDESYGLRFVPGNNANKGGKILAGSTFDHSLELTNTGAGGYNLFVDGNVGIGTNTPDEKMVVQVTDARRYVKFKAPNGEERVQFYVGGTGNASELSMFAANGTSRNVQIATAGTTYFNGGDLGIGTSNPTNRLHVVDDRTGYAPVVVENSNPAGLGLLVKAGDGSTYVADFRKADNTNLVRIDGSGNVGIGTTSPTYKLEVNSDVDDFKQFRIKSTGSPLMKLSGSYNSGNGAEFWQNPSGDIRLNINSTSNGLFIKSNGLIGIGTDTPDEKLAVNGTIHAKEVKVDLTGWPDYVFAKEYDLLSVEEVADFIKKNGHLPKMPSAATVEKDGVLLGDMNKKLLEKIEELTLYTIEQEKKIKALEKQNKRIEQLEAQMKKLLSSKE